MPIFKESYYKDLNKIYTVSYALEDYINRYGIDNKILIESSIKEIFSNWGEVFKKIWEIFTVSIKNLGIKLLDLLNQNTIYVKANKSKIEKAKTIIKNDYNNKLKISTHRYYDLVHGLDTTSEMLEFSEKIIEKFYVNTNLIYDETIDFTNVKRNFMWGIYNIGGSTKKDDNDYLSVLSKSYYVRKKKEDYISSEDIEEIVKRVLNREYCINIIRRMNIDVNKSYKKLNAFLKIEERNISKSSNDNGINISQKRINDCMEFGKYILTVGTNISKHTIYLINKVINNQVNLLKDVISLSIKGTTSSS